MYTSNDKKRELCRLSAFLRKHASKRTETVRQGLFFWSRNREECGELQAKEEENKRKLINK